MIRGARNLIVECSGLVPWLDGQRSERVILSTGSPANAQLGFGAMGSTYVSGQ
jgi:hypothetical protein